MKKLISATLAVTMLTVPLIGSSCSADELKKTDAQYIQNEKRSKPFQMKNTDLKKAGKILAGVTAGAAALTGITATALKLAEDKLPENIKSKLPFLYTKKSQESQENIEKEKTSEIVSEPENSKNETFETSAANSTISKNENAKIVASESETKKTELIDSTIRKPEALKNITTKPAATNNLAVTNNTKTAIIQPTKTNTTSNNIKSTTKNKVNVNTVTPNIITNRTIYTNATNGSSNLNKTSETVSEPENSKNETFETIVTTKSETKKTELIDSTIRKPETLKNITAKPAAINNLTVDNNAKTAITQPAKFDTTSNNIKPATKNKVNASTVTPSSTTSCTVFTNATNGSSNLNKTSENLLSSDTPWKTALISAAAISALTAAVTLAFLNPKLRNSFSQNFEKLKQECKKLGVTLGSSLKSLFSGTRTDTSTGVPGAQNPGANPPAPPPGAPTTGTGTPPSSVVEQLLPVTALGATARKLPKTLTKVAKKEGEEETAPPETTTTEKKDSSDSDLETAVYYPAATTAEDGSAAAGGPPVETITPSAFETIMSNSDNGLGILRTIQTILQDEREKSTNHTYEYITNCPVPHNRTTNPEAIAIAQETQVNMVIKSLNNDPDTANGSVLQRSKNAFKRLSALKAVVIYSTIPGTEGQTKKFFKQLGMSEQPNKEEINKEALRLTNELDALFEMANLLPAVDSPPPLDPEISDALYDIRIKAPSSKKKYITLAERAVKDLRRAQQEQENQSTNSAPQDLSLLTLRKRKALDQIIKLFNLPDKEAQNAARNLFNRSGLGPNVVEEINQECEDKIQKNKEKEKVLEEILSNQTTFDGMSLREVRERYHQINRDLEAYRQATHILNTQRIDDETDTSLRVLTMSDSLTPLSPEVLQHRQRDSRYEYLTTTPNAIVVARVPIEPSFQLPANALGSLLRLPTCAPNLVLRIPDSAADAVTRLPSNPSTYAQNVLTLEALELPEASTETSAAETTATTETMSETAETPTMTSSVAETPETESDVTEPGTASDVTEIPETLDSEAKSAPPTVPAKTDMAAPTTVRQLPPAIRLGKPPRSMSNTEPDSNQKNLLTETAVAATSEGTAANHPTAMAAAASEETDVYHSAAAAETEAPVPAAESVVATAAVVESTVETQTTPGPQWSLVEIIDPTVITDINHEIEMATQAVHDSNNSARTFALLIERPLQAIRQMLITADMRASAIYKVLRLFESRNETAQRAAIQLFEKLRIGASREEAQRAIIKTYEEAKKAALIITESEEECEEIKREAAFIMETCDSRLVNYKASESK